MVLHLFGERNGQDFPVDVYHVHVVLPRVCVHVPVSKLLQHGQLGRIVRVTILEQLVQCHQMFERDRWEFLAGCLLAARLGRVTRVTNAIEVVHGERLAPFVIGVLDGQGSVGDLNLLVRCYGSEGDELELVKMDGRKRVRVAGMVTDGSNREELVGEVLSGSND
ncbi:AAEL009452-PA [Aedes aegypti]|uniref:AAEL009452-PA n=1 Tax=Aedes aegypti TaxID=7159 RepID=Q16VS4_AEDAE|nr:AAEL009452-PA [Aedes aegypti]